jgi:hypothetical protein
MKSESRCNSVNYKTATATINYVNPLVANDAFTATGGM